MAFVLTQRSRHLAILIVGTAAVSAIAHHLRDEHCNPHTVVRAVSAGIASNLDDIATAESVFFARNGRFTASVDSLATVHPRPQTLIAELRFVHADAVSWKAVAYHPVYRFSCYAGGRAGIPPDSSIELIRRCREACLNRGRS